MADSNPKPVFGQAAPAAPSSPRVRAVNREQMLMLQIDVERLVPEDHPARAVWQLVGNLDLKRFYQEVKSVTGRAGQPRFDPRLMISVWVYGLSRGINSARQLSEYCEWEPGLQWLCAMGSVNYHSLSTFRAAHGEALKQLFVDLLGVMSAEGLVTLEEVAVDGTRIRAHCSNDGCRQGERLQEHLEKAAAHVNQLAEESEEECSRREQAARERRRRERAEKVAAAQQVWEKLKQERGEEAAGVQVNVNEPEARVMKHSNGSFAPSYNLQLATDGKEKIIVAAMVSDSGSDNGLLFEVLDEVKANCSTLPKEVLVDGGYVSAASVEQSLEYGIELIGPASKVATVASPPPPVGGASAAFRKEAFTYDAANDTYQCPAAKVLIHVKERIREGGRIEHEYRAKRSDCNQCAHKSECCPKATSCGRTVVRSEPNPKLIAFRAKMESEAYRQHYRKRSEVAEFPNAWLKEKLGLRRFRLSGMAKVAMESLWAVITYNMQQWVRLVWRQGLLNETK